MITTLTFHTTMTLHNWVSSWIEDSLAFPAQRHVIKMWQKTLSLFWIPDILPQHYMHIVVIACSTKVYPFFPSKMCLVVPIHTLWVCYTPFEVVIVAVQSQNVQNMGSKCVWTSSIFFKERWLGQGQPRKKTEQSEWAFNAQGWRLFIVALWVGAVKIYTASKSGGAKEKGKTGWNSVHHKNWGPSPLEC